MATKAYYAWSPIHIKDAVKGDGHFITVRAGDKITREQVGAADWNDLVSCGAVRTERYPSDIRTDESPRNAKLRKINEAIEKMKEPYKGEDGNDADEEGVAVANG